MKIKELEGKTKSGNRIWSDDEIDTLKRYYNNVKAKELIPYLNNKTEVQIYQKACKLGLTDPNK